MKIVLASNQFANKQGVGNPIMYRMQDALLYDKSIKSVKFIPVHNSLKSFIAVRNAIKCADLLHVHFGGLYAFFLRLFLIGVDKPLLITFHGTDIHAKAIKTVNSKREKIKIWLNQKASFLSLLLFDRCGFVAEEMLQYIPERLKNKTKDKYFIQSLGVDYKLFHPIPKSVACKQIGVPIQKYALFSDVSATRIKRRDIADAILKALDGEYQMLLMSGVKQELVPFYINACDFELLTSDEEGSPNIIRECLALNKPVFSVDVGDARMQLEGLNNSSIIERDPIAAAKRIEEVMNNHYVDNSRDNLKRRLDFVEVCKPIVKIYKVLLGCQ